MEATFVKEKGDASLYHAARYGLRVIVGTSVGDERLFAASVAVTTKLLSPVASDTLMLKLVAPPVSC